MPRTAVITDTNASISLSLSEKLSIQQVPIIIQFGEESFRAVYDIDDVNDIFPNRFIREDSPQHPPLHPGNFPRNSNTPSTRVRNVFFVLR